MSRGVDDIVSFAALVGQIARSSNSTVKYASPEIAVEIIGKIGSSL